MKKKSAGEKILTTLLKGLVRQLGAPPPNRQPTAPTQQPGNLSGCGGCKGRR